jgi:hypothetical protein
MSRKATSRNQERSVGRDSFPKPYANNVEMLNNTFLNYESSGMGFQNLGIGWRTTANVQEDPRPDDIAHVEDMNGGGPGNGSPRKQHSNI